MGLTPPYRNFHTFLCRYIFYNFYRAILSLSSTSKDAKTCSIVTFTYVHTAGNATIYVNPVYNLSITP